MSTHSFEHNRRRERFLRIERTKRQLAMSVLTRINEEVIHNPNITEFTAPMLKTDKIALRILREHPEIIARRLDTGRLVNIELDESTQPPELTIRLGQRFEHPDEP